MQKITPIVVLTLMVLSGTLQTAMGRDTINYTVQGSARIVGEDRGQARERAATRAKDTAFQLALSSIDLDTLLVNARLGGGANHIIPYLSVGAVERIQEGVTDQKQGGVDPTIDRYFSMKMRVAVNSEIADPKSDFRIFAALDQPVFTEGKEMQIRIRSNQDCTYAIYLLIPDEGVSRLVPSRLKRDNKLKAGQTLLFPDKAERDHGIRLRAHLPEGKPSTSEVFLVVGLHDVKEVDDRQMQEAIFGLYGGQTVPLKTLVDKIARVPLGHRSEAILHYGIVKASR